MSIAASIERAINLFNEATSIAQRVGGAIKNGQNDADAATLEDAQKRLAEAKARAQEAHDDLDSAISDQLAGG